MNKEEALKIVDDLIGREMKVLGTAICHLEELQFRSVAEQMINDANRFHEMYDYLQVNLK